MWREYVCQVLGKCFSFLFVSHRPRAVRGSARVMQRKISGGRYSEIVMWWLVRSVGVLLLVWACSNLIKAWLRRRAKAASLSWIPGPPSLPFLGTLQLAGLSRTKMFLKRSEFFREYGPIYKVWMFNEPKIFVSDAEYLKLLMTDKSNLTKGMIYDFSKNMIGDGIITSDGDRWFKVRRMATPSFHLERLDSIPSEVIPKLKILLDQLECSSKSNEPFRTLPFLQQYSLNISLGIFMGFNNEEIQGFKKHQLSYIEAIEKSTEIVMARSFNPLMYSDLLFRFSNLYNVSFKAKSELRNYIKQAINQCRNSSASPKDQDLNIKNGVLFDNLTKNEKNALPEELLENEVANFLFAGFDTTSTTVELALFHLGNHLEIQDILRDEALEECPDMLDSGIKLSQLNRLQHLDRFIKECLRITPTVDIISRLITSPINTKKGVLPAGIEVIMDLYNAHHNKAVYPDSQTFDAGRFLPDARGSRDPFSYVPFSAGSRNCIGSRVALIQIKMILIAILLRYSIESTEKFQNLRLYSNVVLRSENGLEIKLKKLT